MMFAWMEEKARKAVATVLKVGPKPRHVAFIMDGNRRYARMNKKPTIEGHALGFETLKQILEWCLDLDIIEVTVYAFSIENFKRTPKEVEDLLALATQKFKDLLKQSEVIAKNDVCVRVLGDLTLLPEELQQVMGKIMHQTRHNSRARLNVCFSYTSREEMTSTCNEIRRAINDDTLRSSDVTQDLFQQSLYTEDSTSVDILIRSSGEVRLSDFLLWQTCESTMVFSKVLWPEFTFWELCKCILQYQHDQYVSLKSVKKSSSTQQLSENAKRFLLSLKEKRAKWNQEKALLYDQQQDTDVSDDTEKFKMTSKDTVILKEQEVVLSV